MKNQLIAVAEIIAVAIFLAAFCGCGGPEDGAEEPFRVLASEQREGYVCSLVEYDGVPAYLLVPDAAADSSAVNAGEKFPALVLLHDHGARFDIGKEKLVRPIAAASAETAHADSVSAEATSADSAQSDGAPEYILRSANQWVCKNFDGAYLADSLAVKGYVVIVPDMLYWGRRSSDKAQLWSQLTFDPKSSEAVKSGAISTPKELAGEIKRLKTEVYEGQREVYAKLQSEGVIWAEKTLQEDAAAVKLLAGLPYVDSERIGAFGFSMGAHRCWLLVAFCPEVSCGAAVSWMTTKEAHRDDNASDFSMRIPRLRDSLDFPEIARCLAPKPMLFISGRQDHLFPEPAVAQAFTTMHSIYDDVIASSAEGAPAISCAASPLRTVFHDGGHNCGREVRELVFGFFDGQLR